MHRSHTVGLDLGGTNIKAGVVDSSGTLLVARSTPTLAAGGVEIVLERMAALVRDVIGDAQLSPDAISSVGVGAPGPISHRAGLIYSAPNLPGWTNVPLRERLGAMLGLPVTLENDANAAAYGEYIAGAARDARDMVLLTLGTGIGGGVVMGGALQRGAFDNAGEVGHMIVMPDGRPCPCGQRGCLERYASANAPAERVRDAVLAGESSALAHRIRAAASVDARDVIAAMDAGDELAARIWRETCRFLAIGIVNLQHLINPAVVVLGGGLINAGATLLDPVRTCFDELSWKIAPDAPKIVLASLGTDAGVIGAAALARASAM